MRSVRSGLWLSVFLMGAAAPAFCQIIVPPNTSGFRIAADTTKGIFEQTVYSTGPFDASLVIFQNAQMKFAASGTVCTSGPMTSLGFPIPFDKFTLKAGDLITFVFAVRHRTTEGGSCSLVVAAIPVGPAASTTPTAPPPTQSKIVRPGDGEFARWVRREEPSLL